VAHALLAEPDAGIGERGQDLGRELVAERAHLGIGDAAQHDRGPREPAGRAGEQIERAPRAPRALDEAPELAATRRDVAPRVGRECADGIDSCQSAAE